MLALLTFEPDDEPFGAGANQTQWVDQVLTDRHMQLG